MSISNKDKYQSSYFLRYYAKPCVFQQEVFACSDDEY